MKSTIINTYDTAGGAAQAAYAISEALNIYTDIRSRILCGTKFSHNKDIDSIIKPNLKWLDKNFNKFVVKQTIGQSYWLPFSKMSMLF